MTMASRRTAFAATAPAEMKSLYSRLRAAGYDAEFVRNWVLPDWWEDSLAQNPANRALAEIAISRMLGLPIQTLRDPQAKLERPLVGDVRLKRLRSTKPDEVAPAIVLAQQAATTIVPFLQNLPPFTPQRDPLVIRAALLKTNPVVDLGALVEFAWSAGVAILHLSALPTASKKFSGLALFSDARPVDVLASASDSPPWLAFHLAHELGHIMLGHVQVGQDGLADIDFAKLEDEGTEEEADRFALLLLTGHPEPQLKAVYGMTAEKLVAAARQTQQSQRVDAGTIALVYGLTAKRMPVAQNALKLMQMHRGARAILGSALKRRLPADLPEVVERFAALAGAA